ncbi:MAG TPA: DUF433 domain-containing protein [Phycisphaerae bacterium]|nr:DUF433 domain-containing protein [Phycisphaerae bacterium]
MTTPLPPLPDFLHHVDGEIRVVGHRISVYHILIRYNAGESPEAIAIALPTLKTSTIHKVIAFYLDHQPEVDAYLRAYAADLHAQESATPPGPSRAELVRRLQDIRLQAHHAADLSH